MLFYFPQLFYFKNPFYSISQFPKEAILYLNTEESRIFESHKQKVKLFNLTSDIFFSIIMNDKLACQEFLDILFEKRFTLASVQTQYTIRSLLNHSICMDVWALDEQGARINLEMQASDNDNHFRRVRYYHALADSETLPNGVKYQALNELYSVYVMAEDFIGLGDTLYEMNATLKGHTPDESTTAQNGIHEYYLNLSTEKAEGTLLGELISYMKDSNGDPKIKEMAHIVERVNYFKENVKGVRIMCEIMERERAEGREEGLLLGREEGLELGREEGIRVFVEDYAEDGISPERIVAKLQKRFHLSEQKAVMYCQRFSGLVNA